LKRGFHCTVYVAMCIQTGRPPVTIPYDTIYLSALKSWRNGQLSLAHGIAT